MLCISYVTDSYSTVCFYHSWIFKVDSNFQFCSSDDFYAYCMNHLLGSTMTKTEPSPRGASVSRTPEKQMKMRTNIPEALDSSWIQDKWESSKSGWQLWVTKPEVKSVSWDAEPRTQQTSQATPRHPPCFPSLQSGTPRGDIMRYGWGSAHGSSHPHPQCSVVFPEEPGLHLPPLNLRLLKTSPLSQVPLRDR